LSNSQHLGCDADAALVQNLNGDFVSLADLSNNGALVHLDVCEVHRARGRCSNAQLGVGKNATTEYPRGEETAGTAYEEARAVRHTAGLGQYLVLLLADTKAWSALFHDEARDTLVALGRIHVRHHQEDASLAAVRDPQLVTINLTNRGGTHGHRDTTLRAWSLPWHWHQENFKAVQVGGGGGSTV
jgi:hypothetical protein